MFTKSHVPYIDFKGEATVNIDENLKHHKRGLHGKEELNQKN